MPVFNGSGRRRSKHKNPGRCGCTPLRRHSGSDSDRTGQRLVRPLSARHGGSADGACRSFFHLTKDPAPSLQNRGQERSVLKYPRGLRVVTRVSLAHFGNDCVRHIARGSRHHMVRACHYIPRSQFGQHRWPGLQTAAAGVSRVIGRERHLPCRWLV